MKLIERLPNHLHRCCYTDERFKEYYNSEIGTYKNDGNSQCKYQGINAYEGLHYCDMHNPMVDILGPGTIIVNDAVSGSNSLRKSVLFVGAKFGEIDLLDDEDVKNEVEFIGCTFLNIVDFSNSTFRSKLLFKDCEFKMGITLTSARTKQIEFSNCTIDGELFGEKLQVKEFLVNNKSKFNNKLTLELGTVQNFLILNSTVSDIFASNLSVTTNFIVDNSIFLGQLSFPANRFEKFLIQNNSEFKIQVNFSECVFHSGIEIKNTKFKSSCNLADTKISTKWSMDHVEFYGEFVSGGESAKIVKFNSCTFEKEASLMHMEYESVVELKGCTFKEGLNMYETIINGVSSFTCDFMGYVNFFQTKFQYSSDFTESSFFDRSNFNHTEFVSGPVMNGVPFAYCPEFHDAKLSQGADFRRASYQNISDDKAPHSYRTLKHAMKNVSNKKQEALFHKMELRSIRKQKETPRSEKVFSWLYDTISEYGQNFFKPFWWFIAVNLLASLVYLLMIPGSIFLKTDNYVIAAKIAFYNIIAPFKIWFVNEPKLLSHIIGEGQGVLFKLTLAAITTVQTILSLILITLFILALRRAFKLN